jgi:hypothetical protein
MYPTKSEIYPDSGMRAAAVSGIKMNPLAPVVLTNGLRGGILIRSGWIYFFSHMNEGNAMHKTIYGVLITVMFLLSSNSGSGAELNDGFFGIEWKANLSEKSGFKKVGENLNVIYFANPERVYAIDEVKIPDVIYGSYTNQFFAVYINIETIEVFSQLRRRFNSEFGVPRISMGTPGQQTTYQWKSKKTKIKLKTYENRNNMKMALYYTPLSRQVNEAQQEAFAENFSNPLFPLDDRRMQKAIDFLEVKRSRIGPR